MYDNINPANLQPVENTVFEQSNPQLLQQAEENVATAREVDAYEQANVEAATEAKRAMQDQKMQLAIQGLSKLEGVQNMAS